jgi:hypothetical protein
VSAASIQVSPTRRNSSPWTHISVSGALLERRFGSPSRQTSRSDRWQGQYRLEVVVCGDSIVSFEATGQAAVDENVLAFWPREHADWLHQARAIAGAVAGMISVNVPRVQTVWTVVSVLSP